MELDARLMIPIKVYARLGRYEVDHTDQPRVAGGMRWAIQISERGGSGAKM